METQRGRTEPWKRPERGGATRPIPAPHVLLGQQRLWGSPIGTFERGRALPRHPADPSCPCGLRIVSPGPQRGRGRRRRRRRCGSIIVMVTSARLRSATGSRTCVRPPACVRASVTPLPPPLLSPFSSPSPRAFQRQSGVKRCLRDSFPELQEKGRSCPTPAHLPPPHGQGKEQRHAGCVCGLCQAERHRCGSPRCCVSPDTASVQQAAGRPCAHIPAKGGRLRGCKRAASRWMSVLIDANEAGGIF